MIYTSPWPDVPIPERSVYDHGASSSFPAGSPIHASVLAVWSNPHGIPDSKVAIIDAPTGRSIT